MNRLFQRTAALSGLVLAAAFTTGCDVGDDAGAADAAVESVRDEACEHMIDGPSAPFTAAATPTDTAPLINMAHHRIDVTLPDSGDGTFGGAVRFEAVEAGYYALYFNSALRFSIQGADLSGVTIEATDVVPECPEVAVEHTVALEVGTYYLVFEGATEPVLGLIHEALAGAEE